jgi:hypothetical protein
MDADRKRRALGLLRKQTSASMLGDALPEDKRPLLVITISSGGEASTSDDEPMAEDEETPEDEGLY